MRSRFASALRFLTACVLIPAVVYGQAAPPSQSLDKHARKIQKTLASFQPGSIVFIEMRDQTQYLGTLGLLSAETFTLNPRKGAVLNLAYADVRRVQQAEARTSNVIVVRHHNGLVFGLILTGVIVGFLVFAVVELKKS